MYFIVQDGFILLVMELIGLGPATFADFEKELALLGTQQVNKVPLLYSLQYIYMMAC